MTNVEKHIEREIDRILAAPPNSDFQRGYFDAPWRSRCSKKLVMSHLRLVPKIAREYCGDGLPIPEGISAGGN